LFDPDYEKTHYCKFWDLSICHRKRDRETFLKKDYATEAFKKKERNKKEGK